MFRIGIDIGYSSLKSVVLSETDTLVFSSNIFHHGNVDKMLKELLADIKKKFDMKESYIGIIGQKETYFKEYQVNDISSLVEGASYINNNIKTIFEIGAQSSRLITGISNNSRMGIKFHVNSSCSAGTGSFLEEQVSRLGIELEDYSEFIKGAKNSVRIAGRCSVFSKTDMIHHQQSGESTKDILLGLSYALARNFKANVVQRNTFEKPVMFLGGVAKNSGVVKAIKEIFNFSDDDFIVGNFCSNIGALGAAIIGGENRKIVGIDKLIHDIDNKFKIVVESSFEPLMKYGNDDCINKHICKSTENIKDCHLGIDIGSTSTNLVIIDNDKNVISYRYIRTMGDPQKSVKEGMNSIENEFNGKLNILSVSTTGSGRNLIGKLLNADLVVNEITAQGAGAIAMDPDIDTIFEIGGQDSKYIGIKNKRVVDFEMNKICAAGTGSFLEEQAIKLEIPIEKYSNIALKGKAPLNLGDRCTVFIEGNISKAITEGQSKEDITAGLSYSIVYNYLNRVVAKKPIGKKISLQGGIAFNQAVVNAFRVVTGKEIIVLPFFSVTGAIGAAILGKIEIENKKTNENTIEKPKDISEEINKLYLNGYTGELEKNKLTVGIPRVLFLHKLFPMFNVFFKELGFNVILSDETTKEIVEMSQEYSLDETCYPIKLINGHVAFLLNRKVDYIFLPSLYTMKHEISKTREDYACVYMQTAPQIVSKVMELDKKGVKLLSPALSFKFGKKYMMSTLMKLGLDLGKTKVQTTFALAKGMKQLKKFEKETEIIGKNIIKELKSEEKVFVIVTRAYGVSDKGLNMEIPQKLRSMGYKVLTLSNLPAHDCDTSSDYSNMYWPFGQHILAGAKIIKNSKNLYAIYLTNHGCGPDTMLSHYFKEEMGSKPYLHIEVDEHASSVGVVTRLEAFVESLKNEIVVDFEEPKEIEKTVLTENNTIYIPHMYPYSGLLKELLNKKGYKAKEMEKTTSKSMEVGKKYSVSKESISLVSLMGDVLLQAKKSKGEQISILIPQNEGSEVVGQYSRLIKQKLLLSGYKNINIESPFIEDMLVESKYGLDYGLILVAGDLILNSSTLNRDDNYKKIVEFIRSEGITNNNLILLSKTIYNQNINEQYKKKIYVLGEHNIVFNNFLNDNSVEKLEEENKIFYQPFSEMKLFTWNDYLIKNKNKNLQLNIEKLREIIRLVSNELKNFTPFDRNFEEMVEEADKKLPMYNGGDGRYRMIKQFRCSNDIDGVLVLNSMYENTGTILKLLKSDSELNHPVIELSFDANKHSSNDERISNFIYYI